MGIYRYKRVTCQMNRKTLLIESAECKKFYIDLRRNNDGLICFCGIVKSGVIEPIYNKSGRWLHLNSSLEYSCNLYVENGNLFMEDRANGCVLDIHWIE